MLKPSQPTSKVGTPPAAETSSAMQVVVVAETGRGAGLGCVGGGGSGAIEGLRIG